MKKYEIGHDAICRTSDSLVRCIHAMQVNSRFGLSEKKATETANVVESRIVYFYTFT